MTTFAEKYAALSHAMQSGVKYDQESNPGKENKKHLRTGINACFVEHHALAQLLIGKGIITAAEYEEALIMSMEAEVKRYEKLLTERYGSNITLG